MKPATFKLFCEDYGLSVSVTCSANEDCYPNQADLREAVSKLMMALSSWDFVEFSVKSVSSNEKLTGDTHDKQNKEQ